MVPQHISKYLEDQYLPQGPILSHNLFSLDIYDLVNIYTDDTKVYGCTSKYLDDQGLTADLSYLQNIFSILLSVKHPRS